MFTRLLCLVVFIAGVWAQTPAPQTGGTIRGTVIGPGNEPLRKAEVMLRSAGRAGAPGGARGPMPMGAEVPGMWSFTTDSSGAFAFSGLPPGRYTLTVRRNGFVQRQSTGRQSGETLTIADGGIQSRTLSMIPHGVISGTVLDEDGEPLVFASVQVLRETWVGGRRQTAPVSGGSTNDLGQYRLYGLAPGRYFLMVSAGRGTGGMRQRPQQGNEDLGYAPIYYPGVVDLAHAVPVTLAPGQEMRGADFQLRKLAVFRIRGKVLDESGAPATQVAVMAMPEGGAFAGARGTGIVRGSDGGFEISGLPPGSYTLFANKHARNQERTFARSTVQVGSRDVDGVVLQMQRTFSVAGTVRVPEGIAVGSMRVVLNSDAGFPSGPLQAAVDAAGNWKADGVSAGQYRFSVSLTPEGTYLKSVSVGGQDITEGAQINGTASQVVIALGGDAPQVQGTVIDRDKQPAGEALVVLVPETSRRTQTWRYRTAAADASGNFALRSVPPGQYTAVALPKDTEDGVWFSPDWIRGVEGSGVTLKLAEKSTETVQVTLAQ